MRDYNDYIKAVRGYLQNYKQLQAATKNLENEAEEKRKELEDVSIAISRYGGEVGGGAGELTATEAAAIKRGRLEEEIKQISGEVERIKSTLDRLDCAIDGLDDIKKRLIRWRFMDNRTWKEIAIEFYMTEKWARVTAGKAIQEIAFMVFGNKALPPEKRFIFL